MVKENGGILALKVFVKNFLSGTVDDASVESVGMEVDSAVELVLLQIEFHHRSPWGWSL